MNFWVGRGYGVWVVNMTEHDGAVADVDVEAIFFGEGGSSSLKQKKMIQAPGLGARPIFTSASAHPLLLKPIFSYADYGVRLETLETNVLFSLALCIILTSGIYSQKLLLSNGVYYSLL